MVVPNDTQKVEYTVAYVNYSGREANDCAMRDVSTSLVEQYAGHSKINPHYPFFVEF